MTLFRYKAVAAALSGDTSPPVRGEIVAATPSEARAALRRGGLRPVWLRAARGGERPASKADPAGIQQLLRAWVQSWRRGRHRALKGDLCDALATLLDAEIRLRNALGALADDGEADRRVRRVAKELRAAVETGVPFSKAMAAHSGWFDAGEIAMANSGESSSDLPRVIRRIGERAGGAARAESAVVGALLYPLIIGLVGVGVALFLANRTLPQLSGVLAAADLDPPALTAAVMGIGGFVWSYLLLLMTGSVLLVAAVGTGVRRLTATSAFAHRVVAGLMPRFLRRRQIARALSHLADLTEAGVPLVDAIPLAAQTCSALVGGTLRTQLDHAGQQMREGVQAGRALESVSALPAEARRIVRVGVDSGELSAALRRVAERTRHQADRALERWSKLAEPAAILVMAVCVGVVVMAAVLPILRLQEIVR